MAGSTEPVVLINLFEVPEPADDDRFLAAWEPIRDQLETEDGYLGTALHRSLSPDVSFRFVNVARWASPEVFGQAIARSRAAGREFPFQSHPALYRPIGDAEAPDRDGAILISPFELSSEDDPGAFVAAWQQASASAVGGARHEAIRLHQSLSPDVRFRFVAIGRYAGAEPLQPGFPGVALAPYRAYPALYEVVRQ